MTAALVAVAVVLGAAAGAGGAFGYLRWRRHRALRRADPANLIAFPFAGDVLSQPALTAALRLARVEGATLMPAYLAIVPRALALDRPLPAECSSAFAMLEAVERRAAAAEVAVDSRIELGRSVRHALARLMEHERLDRILVAVTQPGGGGLLADDVAWLLENATCEVIALRPGEGDRAALRARHGAGPPTLRPGERLQRAADQTGSGLSSR